MAHTELIQYTDQDMAGKLMVKNIAHALHDTSRWRHRVFGNVGLLSLLCSFLTSSTLPLIEGIEFSLNVSSSLFSTKVPVSDRFRLDV